MINNTTMSVQVSLINVQYIHKMFIIKFRLNIHMLHKLAKNICDKGPSNTHRGRIKDNHYINQQIHWS